MYLLSDTLSSAHEPLSLNKLMIWIRICSVLFPQNQDWKSTDLEGTDSPVCSWICRLRGWKLCCSWPDTWERWRSPGQCKGSGLRSQTVQMQHRAARWAGRPSPWQPPYRPPGSLPWQCFLPLTSSVWSPVDETNMWTSWIQRHNS